MSELAEVVPIRRARTRRLQREDWSHTHSAWHTWHRRKIELFADAEKAAHELSLDELVKATTRCEMHQMQKPPVWPGDWSA